MSDPRDNKPVDAFEAPSMGRVVSRRAVVETVEPLDAARRAQIVDAVILWSHARSLYYAGKMGRSEYQKRKTILLDLVKTKEV